MILTNKDTKKNYKFYQRIDLLKTLKHWTKKYKQY